MIGGEGAWCYMGIEVFNRYEKKYLISNLQYELLLKHLYDYMEDDVHNKDQTNYTICNVYYDTENNYLIRHSIDKPIYKEKLRLRSYGTCQLDSLVYLELKKKYEGMVNKRRTTIKLLDAYNFIESRTKPKLEPYMNAQVLNELSYFIMHYRLKPQLVLSYDRKALFGKDDKNFRITFDSNILTRRYDIGLEYGIYGMPLLKEDLKLMEIKLSKGTPLELCRLLSQYKIYPTSFSKYGTEYKNSIGRRINHV